MQCVYLVAIPIEVVIYPVSLTIQVSEGIAKGIKRIDVVRFIDVTFSVLNDQTGEQYRTELVAFSLN